MKSERKVDIMTMILTCMVLSNKLLNRAYCEKIRIRPTHSQLTDCETLEKISFSD